MIFIYLHRVATYKVTLTYMTMFPQGEAKGELYADDGQSLDYKDGKYLLAKFQLANGNLMKW